MLVGHSMGGLIARLQTLSSGNDFWRLASDKPFSELVADARMRADLSDIFFFEPNPSVRRVITIATPHRGTNISNETTQWLGRRFISLPKDTVQGTRDLLAENPNFFPPNSLVRVSNTIESLSPKLTILPVMLSAPCGPWITYHNIVGRVPQHDFLGHVAGDGDGVVPFANCAFGRRGFGNHRAGRPFASGKPSAGDSRSPADLAGASRRIAAESVWAGASNGAEGDKHAIGAAFLIKRLNLRLP